MDSLLPRGLRCSPRCRTRPARGPAPSCALRPVSSSANCSASAPSSITATRLQIAPSTESSWLTITMVTPSRRLMSRRVSSSARVVSASSAEVGSSHSSTAGPAGQRAGDGHALLLAARQLRRIAVAPCRPVRPGPGIAAPARRCAARSGAPWMRSGKATLSNTVAFCSRLNCWKIMPMLWRGVAQVALGQRRQLVAVDGDGAAVGPLEQINQAQQGGFAGAALADQAEDVAFVHVERRRRARRETGRPRAARRIC